MAETEQWIHMVGICGSGMSGIAKILRHQGHQVSGSDLRLNGSAESLSSLGIKLWEGHSAEHIDPQMDLLVISSAIKANNPEVQKANAMSIDVIKRGDMLARMHNQARGIAVAGAHGKTTTSSMLAVVLSEAGLDPTFAIGGELKGTHINSRYGGGSFFVCEADESDGSFLALQPEIAVITNVEEDHLDHYHSRQSLEKAFQAFVDGVKPGGIAVLWAGDAYLTQIRVGSQVQALYYGTAAEDADYYYDHLITDGPTSAFEVYYHEECLGQVQLNLPGVHNVLNALAVVAVGHQLGISWEQITSSLSHFQGARRRLEITGQGSGVTVIDDYAHHPTEVEATLKAVRQFHQGRMLVIFQPHRFTRTQALGEKFGPAFKESDLLIVTQVYAAGELPIEGVSGEMVSRSASAAGINTVYMPNQKDIVPFLLGQIQANDLVLTMGAGDVWETGIELCHQLDAVNLNRV
ncbi:MAG: UDP-N-acetylmuramate--L-alanine ligase [Methylocystaceae bacterium]